MIYSILFFCAIATLVIIILGILFRLNKELLIELVQITGSLVLLFGSQGLFWAMVGYVGPLEKYAHELHQQVPSINGKLICEGSTLHFKGTQNVRFVWRDQFYQVAYPTTKKLSGGATYCALDILPNISVAQSKMELNEKETVLNIEKMLDSQKIPQTDTLEEKQLFERLLLTFNPIIEPKVHVNILSTDGPAHTKLEVQREPSKLDEHSKVSKADKPATTRIAKQKALSPQELMQNISAQ
jgi:hypothetical protein